MRTPAALRPDLLLRTVGLQARRSAAASVISGMSLLGVGIVIGASLGLLFGTRGGAQVRRSVRRAARSAVGSRPPRPGKHVADARDSAYGASDYGVRVSPVKA